MSKRYEKRSINTAIVGSIVCITLLILTVKTEIAFSHDTRMFDVLGLDGDPDEADLHMYRGNAFVRNGQYEYAIEEYTKTLILEPYNALAYINRAITYMDLGKYEEAHQDLNLALGLEPDNYEIYMNRGLVYADMNQFDSAIIDCNKAIELDSTAEAFANRGNYYSRLGKLEKGLADCEHALFIDSSYASAWLGCTIINMELGRKVEVVKAFKVLLEYNPSHLYPIIKQLKSIIDTTTHVIDMTTGK